MNITANNIKPIHPTISIINPIIPKTITIELIK